mgnify:CR=1 FL=1
MEEKRQYLKENKIIDVTDDVCGNLKINQEQNYNISGNCLAVSNYQLPTEFQINDIKFSKNYALFINCDVHPDTIPLMMLQEKRKWTPVWTRSYE